MPGPDRNRPIPFGAQKAVHEESGYSKGFVSEVANEIAPLTKDARVVAKLLARKAKKPLAVVLPKYARAA